MYKEIVLILIGIILGMICMYYIMKPSIGNKYNIDNDIKNKKGVMSGNTFKSTADLKSPKKERLFKRLKNKRLTKRKDKNGIITKS